MKKIPVGILGATGAVGQRFVELLLDHPWFEIKSLAASERSQGLPYKSAARWMMPTPLPEDIGNLIVETCLSPLAPKLLFSALDSSVAGEVEDRYASEGHTIISNAKNHRMNPDVPLVIPEVNGDHLELLQGSAIGKIICVPNCSTVGLTLALKPLHEQFGIEALQVTTLQAISGAGYPGVPSLDIMDNVIPYISDEEEKMETETLKLLGTATEFADIKISAQCNRVGVIEGHTECVSVKFHKKPSIQAILDAWNLFPSLELPLSPRKLIWVHQESRFPQPKLHRHLDKAMSVHVGRLRECNVLDFKFVLLSHNTVRGAAGGGILIAELLKEKGMLAQPLFSEEVPLLNCV